MNIQVADLFTILQTCQLWLIHSVQFVTHASLQFNWGNHKSPFQYVLKLYKHGFLEELSVMLQVSCH